MAKLLPRQGVLCEAAERADDTFTAHRMLAGDTLNHDGLTDGTLPRDWSWNDLVILATGRVTTAPMSAGDPATA